MSSKVTLSILVFLFGGIVAFVRDCLGVLQPLSLGHLSPSERIGLTAVGMAPVIAGFIIFLRSPI